MEEAIEKIQNEIFVRYPEIELLLLFGSRARKEATKDSDWDFGYIASKGFDDAPLYTDLVLLLRTEKVDLVDLNRANALLRFRAISDGIAIFDKTGKDYEKLWLAAAHFWCDAGPIIRAGYRSILKGLK